MKTGKVVRTLSLLLAMLMLAGMIPAAFATENTGNEIQEAAAGVQPVAESASVEEEEISESEDGSVIVYRAFDVSLQKDGQEIAAEGEFRVTVETGLDAGSLIPEDAECVGTGCRLYHVHEGKADIVEDAEMDDDGILTFTTPNFSTFLLEYTVKYRLVTEYIAASGETFTITVEYDDEAGIPDDAELNVREILEGDDSYREYIQQSMQAFDGYFKADENAADQTRENYARIFDIEILANGQKIEPKAAVSVSIALTDAPASPFTELKVVHFGTDGIEVMETEETAGEKTEIKFLTDEFSVYTVMDANSATLNNQSFALVSGIAGDPGATTGYHEDWDQDYFTIIVNAHAVMDFAQTIDNNTGLGAEGVHAWTDSTGSYVGGDATQWSFEPVGDGTYRIYVEENGTRQYIVQNWTNGQPTENMSISTNQSWATHFTITPNNDGTVLLHSGNWYLHNNAGSALGGWDEWTARNYIMTQNSNAPTGNDYKFRLCKKSDDFDSFAAQKVSAAEVTTNANYLIYRKFEDEHGNEFLYALAHDGTFVRVYDGGDTVYWRETDKNIYWNYQMDANGGYPVLFTRDPVTNNPIYISPSHSTGQTTSSEAKGLTLLGKDNGEYSTAIECWDQASYDYAGLHVTLENEEATLSTGTRVTGTSDEFLFAVATQMPGATAEIVDTVDSDSLGIKITMFDYGSATTEYDAGYKLQQMTDIAGSAEYTPHAAHALVKPYLESGVPSGSAGAMTGLFSSGGAITYSQANVNHLFLKSYYDESGTFRYRSEDNYAYLGLNGNTDFTVYRQAATPYTSDISVGHTYYHHGHFMPYNDIDMNNNLSRLMNQYGNAYDPEKGEIIGGIPLGDGRTYEDIYGVQGTPNFYTGMKMEANFSQPRGGKLENGDDMVFRFTGDDDMWVYIDDVLVLDIGGIHEPLSGTIDFAKGIVTNPTGSSLAGERTLYQIFQNVLNTSGTPQAVKDKIAAITWKDVDGDGTPDTFADYTNHSFSAFYMERGAGASNLDIQFNLKVTLTGEFRVQKELPEGIDERFANQLYKFQATYKDSTDNDNEKPLYAGAVDSSGKTVCTSVVYLDRKDEHGDPVPVSVDDNGCFSLKAGEVAVFKMADDSIQYNVKEIEIDENIIAGVDINGNTVSIVNNTAEAGFTYIGNRSQVLYQNHPQTRNLLITKHIEGPIPVGQGENPVFEFRVYLESFVLDENGSVAIGENGEPETHLIPYSYGPYYLVKEVEGVKHYYTLTGPNNAPEDKGTNPVVCSTTGRSGSINSIPPEYTIVIPNLTIGTNFYLEERRDNLPDEYEFVREELKEGTYDPQNLYTEGAVTDVINRILARDEHDTQEFDPSTIGRIHAGTDAESHVYNKKRSTEVKILKTDDKENSTNYLTGAVFELWTKPNIEAEWQKASKDEIVQLDDDGRFEITSSEGIVLTGLKAGIYKLVEITPPNGYIITNNTPVTFEVRNGKIVNTTGTIEAVSFVQASEGDESQNIQATKASFTIPNPPGIELPKTGASGSRPFYAGGGVLALAAGLMLARRKKYIA